MMHISYGRALVVPGAGGTDHETAEPGKSEDFLISDEQRRNTCVSPACPALRLKKETSLGTAVYGSITTCGSRFPKVLSQPHLLPPGLQHPLQRDASGSSETNINSTRKPYYWHSFLTAASPT